MNFEKRKVDLHIIDALTSEDARKGRSEALAVRYHLRDTSIPQRELNRLDRIVSGLR